MSAAETLRSAAKMLRERAEQCDPWQGDEELGIEPWHDGHAPAYQGDTDAPLIQVMHPGVALALADWLDQEVAALDFLGGLEDETFDSALRVAEAILGGGDRG